MYYSVSQVNKFRYSVPIRESVMEVRMQPLNGRTQRCLSFGLAVRPHTAVQVYRDCMGNIVHHFDVPGRHDTLHITAEAMVEVNAHPAPPDSLPPAAWNDVRHWAEDNDAYEMLWPSHFAQPTELLLKFADEIGARRHDDPMTLLRRISAEINARFAYMKATTRADSPIDEALSARQGVCQDFTHIFIALTRHVGIACRYVSGYFYSSERKDRIMAGATHAWAEALLPGLGWVGFDPTNNSIADTRHIRVAIGRDYADVPPTRGVFKKTADTQSKLDVMVRITPASPPMDMDEQLFQPQALSPTGDFAAQPEQQQQ
jgi:transglutaminase-like putative cysteine protease